jgi:hypothetical protein
MDFTKFCLAAAVFLSAVWAQADFVRLTAAEILNVEVTEVQDRGCERFADRRLFTFSLKTPSEDFQRRFCSNELSRWQNLERDLVSMVVGSSSVSCVISEVCDRRSCRRVYGRSKTILHEIILRTGAGSDIVDYSVRKEQACE